MSWNKKYEIRNSFLLLAPFGSIVETTSNPERRYFMEDYSKPNFSLVKVETVSDSPIDMFADYVARIRSHWQKASQSILIVARLCVEADASLHAGVRPSFIKNLPFCRSTHSKLLKIGKHERFKNTDFTVQLPPSFSVIYGIACLSLTKFDAAVSEGVISPKLTRANLERWKRGKPMCAEPSACDSVLYARIYASTGLNDQAEAALRLTLIAMIDAETIDVDWVQNERANIKFVKEMQRCLVRSVRGRVSTLQKKLGKKFKERWQYPEELKVEKDATHEKLQEVLSLIGLEDEWERILRDAENGKIYEV